MYNNFWEYTRFTVHTKACTPAYTPVDVCSWVECILGSRELWRVPWPRSNTRHGTRMFTDTIIYPKHTSKLSEVNFQPCRYDVDNFSKLRHGTKKSLDFSGFINHQYHSRVLLGTMAVLHTLPPTTQMLLHRTKGYRWEHENNFVSKRAEKYGQQKSVFGGVGQH